MLLSFLSDFVVVRRAQWCSQTAAPMPARHGRRPISSCTRRLLAVPALCLGLLLGGGAPYAAQAQTPDWRSALSVGAPASGAMRVNATAVNAAGDVFVTGRFAVRATFGSTILSDPAFTGDIFLAKWNVSTQSWAWAVRAGGTASDQGLGLAVNGTSVYLTGSITNDNVNANAVAFGGVPLNGLSAAATADVFVAKYTDNGMSVSFNWAEAAGGANADQGNAITVSGSNVYLTGAFRNTTTDGNLVTFGGATLLGRSALPDNDVFVAKYTDNGNSASFGWATANGGRGGDVGTGIAVNGTNVYVTGYFSNNTTNNTQALFGSGTLLGLSSTNNSDDVFVAKYTDGGSNPTFEWARADGGLEEDRGNAIAVSGTNLYVTGQFTNNSANNRSVTFGGSALLGLGSSNSLDVFTARYSDGGTSSGFGWAVAGGGTGADAGQAIALDGNRVHVTGRFINNSGNTNTVTFGGATLLGASSANFASDIFVASYTDNGATTTYDWARAAGSSNADEGRGIAVSTAGRVWVGGGNSANAIFGTLSLSGEAGFLALLQTPGAPTLTTAAPTAITVTTATLGGNVTDGGGVSVTTRGVVYVPGLATPIIGGPGVVQLASGSGTGAFTANATSLTAGTTYTVRAYATNSLGTSYGFGQLLQTLSPPTLTSLSPATAPVGTTITLTGTNLTGATGVSFNGTAATTFSVTNATTATATVPVGATSGVITITTPGGPSNGLPFTVGLTDLVVNTALTASGRYNDVTVLSGGVLTLGSTLNVAGTLHVEDGGTLDLPSARVEGTGNFELQAGGRLAVTNVDGINASGATGAVRVTGTRSFSSDAIYEFRDPRSSGVTGTGLPATVRELIISGSLDGITLSQPTAVSRVLRLNRGVFNTQNQLTLLSDATRQAYVVHTSGTTSGTVTVQRYVGGPAAVGYRHLASPVRVAPVSDLATTGFTPKVNPAYNNLPYVAPPVASFPNVLGFDETRGGTTPAYQSFTTGYYSPATLATVLAPGRGYSVAMNGDKTPDFVGELTSGNVSQALSVTGVSNANGTTKGGWHLLGNPYAQPIDWDLATVPAGLSSGIFVYRTTGGNNGQYLTRANGLGTLPEGVLPIGQGFFVLATAPTAFTFSNALRVESNAGPVARLAPDTRPRLTLTLSGTTGSEATTVYAQDGATLAADAAFDALRPGPNVGVPTLASLINGQEAAINGLPLDVRTTPATVELTAKLPTVGTYTLAVGELANWGTTAVSLLDRLTNTRYDLTQAPVLTLTATRANQEVAGRFAVVLNGQRVLGVATAEVTAPVLSVWPNPSAASQSVQVTGCLVSSPVALFDVAGRRVGSAVADATGAATLRTEGLSAGVYVVRAADGRTVRLVVE